MPPATTSEGRTPRSAATSASATDVATNPPAAFWKKAGSPRRPSASMARPTRTVAPNAAAVTSGPAPSRRATAAASTARAAVTTARR
ncbi:hypothetical protein ABC795_14005 [Blastococcus sp. HT6-30]|uniref:hypothetical protein n=1 Tax=Blastococcus sp. HT6-30 TaxID=3144843 RepID=UPI00321A57F1